MKIKLGYAVYTRKDRKGNYIDGDCYVSEELARKNAAEHARYHINHMIECYTIDEFDNIDVLWQEKYEYGTN